MAKTQKVTLAEVRTWAEGKELVGKGQRGKLPVDVIEAFEKAHPGRKYDKSAAVLAKRVEVKAIRVNPETGRKTPIRKMVLHSEVRQAAIQAGVAVPARGQMPQSVLTAYVAGSLGELVSA